MSKESAIVSWLNSCNISTLPQVFSGGFHTNLVLHQICNQIDGIWFHFIPDVSDNLSDDNWIICFEQLKKLHATIVSWFHDHLQINVLDAISLDLKSIARKENCQSQSIRFFQIILAIAAHSDNGNSLLNTMLLMDPQDQDILKSLIQEIINEISDIPSDSKNTPVQRHFESENTILSLKIEELVSKLDQLQSQNHLLIQQNDDLKQTVQEHEKNSNIFPDIDSLKLKLQQNEIKLDEATGKLESQECIIIDLNRQLEETEQQKSDLKSMKDKLQEFRFVADKLQKAEMILEKYKRKVEEMPILKNRIKDLEKLQEDKETHIQSLQEEVRKQAILKSFLDSYKDKVTTLEVAQSSLDVEKNALSKKLESCNIKLIQLENEKIQDKEELEKLRTLLEDSSNINTTEIPESSETIDQIIISKSNHNQYIEKIETLKKENRDLYDRILTIENQMDDLSRTKNAFEQDYKRALESNHVIEKQNQDLKLQNAHLSNSNISTLTANLQESENTLADTLRINQEQSNTLQILKQQLEDFKKGNKSYIAQVNKLFQEKELLSKDVLDKTNEINSLENHLGEIKGKLASLESRESSDGANGKLGSATQKVVQLTDQNAQLHQALKRAKDHILLQDKMIKERKANLSGPENNHYEEAIRSFEIMVENKDAEISRLLQEYESLKETSQREQRLMTSAWYELGTKLVQQNESDISSMTPTSWLKKQRDML